LPLTAAYAQERAAQPAPVAPAQPAKPEAHKPQAAKPAAAVSGTAPAAHSGTPTPPAQPTAASKPAKAKATNKTQAKTAKTNAAQPVAAAPAPANATAPAQPAPEALAQVQPPLRLKSSEPPQPSASGAGPICSLAEPEQPRGGRLDVLGDRFGSAPVVRIAGKPARMLERRADRISVQIPADSDGGAITLQNDGKALACGNLVIIGKNR
jgi:hypothetical protein